MLAYVYTVTKSEKIRKMFQVEESAAGYGYFVGSKFSDKEKAFEFARKIEEIKSDVSELSQMIKVTPDRGYFLSLAGKINRVEAL